MQAFSLNQTIGGSYPADPNDVLRAKKGLNRLGFYAMPKYGMTPWLSFLGPTYPGPTKTSSKG